MEPGRWPSQFQEELQQNLLFSQASAELRGVTVPTFEPEQKAEFRLQSSCRQVGSPYHTSPTIYVHKGAWCFQVHRCTRTHTHTYTFTREASPSLSLAPVCDPCDSVLRLLGCATGEETDVTSWLNSNSSKQFGLPPALLLRHFRYFFSQGWEIMFHQ